MEKPPISLNLNLLLTANSLILIEMQYLKGFESKGYSMSSQKGHGSYPSIAPKYNTLIC